MNLFENFYFIFGKGNLFDRSSVSIRNPTPALFSDKYCFCQKCFNDIQSDVVPLCDDPSQPTT